MRKRRPALTDDQMAFTFAQPKLAREEGDLAGLTAQIASACGRALNDDKRSRGEIAGHMSALTSENVTRWMLDAYASEARDGHNVSAARFLALIAATGRFDILDAVITRIGARILVGAEVHAARLGHLLAAKAQLDEQIRSLRPMVEPFSDRRGR